MDRGFSRNCGGNYRGSFFHLLTMAKAWQPIILVSTGILLLLVVIKVFMTISDILDKVTAIFAILLFFLDQITR